MRVRSLVIGLAFAAGLFVPSALADETLFCNYTMGWGGECLPTIEW